MSTDLPSNEGISALGGALKRMMRSQVTRQRPQAEFGEITQDLALLPHSWSGEPFSWGRYSVAGHLEIHAGDHVMLDWMSGRPVVTDLIGMTDDDERNADHTRRRVRELETRLADLEAAFAAHTAGHP